MRVNRNSEAVVHEKGTKEHEVLGFFRGFLKVLDILIFFFEKIYTTLSLLTMEHISTTIALIYSQKPKFKNDTLLFHRELGFG